MFRGDDGCADPWTNGHRSSTVDHEKPHHSESGHCSGHGKMCPATVRVPHRLKTLDTGGDLRWPSASIAVIIIIILVLLLLLLFLNTMNTE